MSSAQNTLTAGDRAAARGAYIRWLGGRFRDLDLMQTLEGQDKVHLRKVFVPLYLDTEDRRDEDIGQADDVEQEQPAGYEAFDLIAGKSFTAIAGRPGSGKTTLVQAIIGELCSEAPSSFRKRVVGSAGVLPVPLILRDHAAVLALADASLDDLLNDWWQAAAREARDKQRGLDQVALKASYARDGDAIPLMLLFDGIDEVGGREAQLRVLTMAAQAVVRGWRVVLTGRPSGYADLDLTRDPSVPQKGEDYGVKYGLVRAVLATINESTENLRKQLLSASAGNVLGDPSTTAGLGIAPDGSLVTGGGEAIGGLTIYHVQPFVWSQVQQFMQRFYQLFDAWRRERERGIEEFNQALRDPQRGYLLTLARRPIFLTLMALVHVNDRRMPDGRGDLYQRIIDLYLVRQNDQRRQTWTREGKDMPHWNAREVRRALGYLAWRSQQLGAEAKDVDERNNRQVVWTRAAMLQALQELLSGDAGQGRFRELQPWQADDLLNFFLHPTGLLIEPDEGRLQFAHLSFQEYLCAEFIHGRALARGSRGFLAGIHELLFSQLGRPGWDEVALLLLIIHSAQGAQSDAGAHEELLAELDLAELPQARLLIAALTGGELDYGDEAREAWLAPALAACLIHPEADLAGKLGQVDAWRFSGRDWLGRLFVVPDPSASADMADRADPYNVLQQAWRVTTQKEDRAWGDGRLFTDALAARWQQPPDDESWDGSGDDARNAALLLLAGGSTWVSAGGGKANRMTIDTELLGQQVANWLGKRQGRLYLRDERQLPLLSADLAFTAVQKHCNPRI